MRNIQELSESFQLKFERFLIGCDAVQAEGGWSTENLGEMGVYYTRELLTMILRIVSADGWVSQREADYLNKFFGFTYTAQELEQVCDGLEEPLHSHSAEKTIHDSVKLLHSMNPKLAHAFRELMALACDIISLGDGIVTDEEREEIERLRKLAE